jgi:glutamyl/glutaminyl-tRNA synthetase
MQPGHTFNRTRLAPTPSGFLHLGNALSFAITAALARRANAAILLRIDDLDRDRVNRKYVQDIFDTLNFLEIPWDEGPRNYDEYEKEYSQQHRMPLYSQALKQLQDEGQVFACECSRAQIASMHTDGAYPGTCRDRHIPLDKPGVSWRLYTPTEQQQAVKTLFEGTIMKTLPSSMKDFIVRKKDGHPAYQLTSVVDDQYFGVDLVVRGEDLWPSTVAQFYLSGLLPGNTFRHSTFHHHTLLQAPSGGKLSKSAGATSIQFLRKEGRTKEDIFTLIARMLGINEPVLDFQSLYR